MENKCNFFEDEPVSLYLKDMELIERKISSKQEISIYQHDWLGKILIINNEIQHIENYQTLYHELLVHLPASFIPSIKKVLILGGGSLFAAFEVLKYPSIQQVILCDYDKEVLTLMGKYYEHARVVLSNAKFVHIECDANEYVQKCKNQFDLIINDCFNISKQSNFYNISYYNLLLNLCSPMGVCVDVIYRHIFDKETTIDTISYLNKISQKAFSLVTVPEYPGILHLETIWGKSPYISQNAVLSVNEFQINNDSKEKPLFNYFSTQNIPFYLYLPPYIREKFIL